MKKVLDNNLETKEYLNTLPKIYLVVEWAMYGVMEFPFTGKYKNIDNYPYPIPLVYNYDDHNGVADNWYLMPITYTTTGRIRGWYNKAEDAYLIANKLNEKN